MNIDEKLKRLRREDIIWIIYFFIAGAALYSNELDRVFLKNHNVQAYKKEKTINITIFVIAFFIYLYFVLLVTTDINKMEHNFNNPKYRHDFIQLIGALLFLIGGAIYLYLEITTNDAADVGIIS